MVFLGLEHGESSRSAAEVFEAGPGLMVDLAADFRVQDLPSYERHYGPHRAPALVEPLSATASRMWSGRRLRGASAIAAPGCFATAAQLVLYPFARAGLDITPSLFAVTGSSGAGVAAQDDDPSSRQGAQSLCLLGALAPARGRDSAGLASLGGTTGRRGQAAGACGTVRSGHLSHLARISPGWDCDHGEELQAPLQQNGSVTPTPAVHSSGCSTRHPSSPMW